MANPRIDHVGIVVDDLDRAIDFFVTLGFEVQGTGDVQGDWVDEVIAVAGTHSTIVMLQTPSGQRLELSRFHEPVSDEPPSEPEPANRLGIRHVAVVVDDVDACVATLADKGFGLVGTVVDYENVYRLCYVRGPAGIIVELAQEL